MTGYECDHTVLSAFVFLAFAIGFCFRLAALWFKWEEPMPRLLSDLFQGKTERESLKEKMQPNWEPEE